MIHISREVSCNSDTSLAQVTEVETFLSSVYPRDYFLQWWLDPGPHHWLSETCTYCIQHYTRNLRVRICKRQIWQTSLMTDTDIRTLKNFKTRESEMKMPRLFGGGKF